MAIQSVNNINAGNAATQTKPTSKSSVEANKQPASQATADSVSITSTAQDIKKTADVTNSEPVVNESRVAEIKAAVQAGTYKIDPDRVAKKMMQLETKLANST